MTDPNAFTRREFVGRGLTLASAVLAVPHFLQASALALPHAAAGMASIPGVNEDHVLVVVQFSGGNDGLNTVVPFGADEYYKARPSIAVQPNDAVKLTGVDGIGLHPGLSDLADMYNDSHVAIVQGVGYPNPNRSHFKSMDIWHTADTSATGNGWLGRYFDNECCGFGKGESGKPEGAPSPQGQPGIALGRTAPLAMQGAKIKPISFETPDLFRWIGRDVHESLDGPYHDLTRRGATDATNTNANFLLRTALDAQVASETIRKAVALTPLVEYPRSELAEQLAMVAAMIRAGMSTRVYYVTLGGFDTHAGQGGAQGRQANLLRQYASSLKAFYGDLKQQGNDTRVLTLTFSEFGRRVGQNASGGTDHGTAAPTFLVGPMVQPGVHGPHPSLTDLDQGDLKYKVDFRSIYAAILANWLDADATKILERKYKPAPVIKT